MSYRRVDRIVMVIVMWHHESAFRKEVLFPWATNITMS